MKKELTVYCDGGARGNPGPAAAAFVVERDGRVIHKESRFLGRATNNEAEYAAVLLAVHWLLKNPKNYDTAVLLVLDSELVAKQLSGIFKIKSEKLRNYFFSIKELERKIQAGLFYKSVSRNKNKLADFLVNKTLDENFR